jgi:Flp pilus assembly protein TadG
MQLTDPRERGQGLVEFALVLPLLVLLMLGLFDAGRLVLSYSELSNASRVGARVAMVNQSQDSTCTGSVQTYKCAAADLTVSMGLAAADIATAEFEDRDGNIVSPEADICSQFGRCSATVTVAYTYSPITPIIGSLIGDIELQAKTTMQLERNHADPANP